MNTLPTIRVMISSRAESKVFAGNDQVLLTDLRKRLQAMLHSVRWSSVSNEDPADLPASQQIFDVWIHENDPGQSSASDTFAISLEEIDKANIVIVLYNGEAGDAIDDRGIGICHAEYQQAAARRGNVVYVVKLDPLTEDKTGTNTRFQDHMKGSRRFHVTAKNEEQLRQGVLQLLHKAVAELVKRGASGGRSRDRGLALDWSRLDMSSRCQQMKNALATELFVPGNKAPNEGTCKIELAGSAIAACLHAVPGAMGEAAAREMLGQPFLRDHRWTDQLSRKTPGVVHLIACYKGVTENQASKIIGTPDTMTVASDFGVYAADHVQQIQMIFLANCADTVALAVAVRRLSEWLQQTGEIKHLEGRAQGRRSILNAISKAIPGQ